MTDKQKIIKWFKKRKYLTCMQAIHYMGIYNLRSRVAEMPEVVKGSMIAVKRQDGQKVRVARYRLA